jgi:serine/threonine protein kinase
MALASGCRLGPYEILAPLGSGGIGEVYRARDTRLKREVAVKVLSERFSEDPDRLARFQREAELLATLNHPGIAAVYGIEHADVGTGIVMELVDGETLADVIARGPLAVGDALAIAKQLADALEAAHEKGIIHRDFKPANIVVQGEWGPTSTRGKAPPILAGTPPPRGSRALASSLDPPPRASGDVRVKVLDFGLAKFTELGGPKGMGRDDLSGSPTITSPAATRMGVILGTAAYMAPEQARGKAIDKRADVWASGAPLRGKGPKAASCRHGGRATGDRRCDDAVSGRGCRRFARSYRSENRAPSIACELCVGCRRCVSSDDARARWSDGLPASIDPKANSDLWVLPLTGDRKPRPFAQAPFNETSGQASPDGRWMAYVSSETGRAEVYVRPFPTSPGKWPISTSGGIQPRWRRDGKELFYVSPSVEGRLFTVETEGSGATFDASAPKPLFDTRLLAPGGNAGVPYQRYAVSPDGRRFLIPRQLSAGADEVPAAITVVLNWQAALGAREK